MTDVGGMSVSVTGVADPVDLPRPVKGAMGLGADRSQAPGSVRVQVADAGVAKAAGVSGVVVSVSRADGVSGAGRAHLSLGYDGFRNAFGADYAHRLHLFELPACALTRPERRECVTRRDLGAVNAGGALTADLSVPGDPAAAGVWAKNAGGRGQVTAAEESPATVASSPMVLALAATASTEGATFTATSLNQASSWTAGGQGGSFSYSYPFKVPPSMGGPAPQVGWSYDSGAVDGQTLASNGQAVFGEGWKLSGGGFIERGFRSCALIDASKPADDQCWFSAYNATMQWNGKSVQLVRDAGTGVWKASDDAGIKIEQLFATGDGNSGLGNNWTASREYWKVTDKGGTQYYFGAGKRFPGDTAQTLSAQMMPVYGITAGAPCSVCQLPYRWNLDYVVDPSGNSETLFYTRFDGYVGANNNTNVQSYTVNANLDHIDYGTRAGQENTAMAPMRVNFEKTLRCNGACAQNTSDYPETPWDLYCSSATSCPNTKSAVFFNQYKISQVGTFIWNTGAGAYRNVDKWDLAYSYRSAGVTDDMSSNLWLDTITHTGYAQDGTTGLAEPAVTFQPVGMRNKVDYGSYAGDSPYTHFRIGSILNGVGGQTLVTYSGAECVNHDYKPKPDANPNRCYPQFYKPAQSPAAWRWFNKYLVTDVVDKDLTGGGPDETWHYDYSTTGTSDVALWSHDYAENSVLATRSWNLWHGYPTVTTTHGAAGGPQTVDRNLYFRGMHGDGRASGDNQSMVWGARSVGLSTPVLPAVGTAGQAGAIAGTAGRCLNITGSGTANGTAVQSWDCTGAANQVWKRQTDLLVSTPLVNPATGKCLDMDSTYGGANGSIVQLWDCSPGAWNQLWQFQPDGSLRNPQTGRCLEIGNWALGNGGRAQVWDCANQWNQKWQPQASGALMTAPNARCVDNPNASTANGNPIVNLSCNGSPAQVWQPQANSAILNPAAGKCLDVANAATTNGSIVELYQCNGTAAQVWKPQDDGTLKNPNANKCLSAGFAANSNQLTIWDCNPTDLAQRWTQLIPDSEGLQGYLREAQSLDGAQIADSTIHTPTAVRTALRATPIAGGQDLAATMVTGTDTRTRTWIPGSSTWRWTQTETSFDSYGLPVGETDRGDTTTTDDDACTTISYARNTAAAIVDRVAQQEVTNCGIGGSTTVLQGQRTFYDGQGLGQSGTTGLVTRTEKLTTAPSTYTLDETMAYDTLGRATKTTDALGRDATVAYTPAATGPLTKTVSTNAAGHVTTTDLDPGRDAPVMVTDPNGGVTEVSYDPLGRVSAVWSPTEPRTGPASSLFEYTLSASVPSKVTQKKLQNGTTYLESHSYYNGFMDQREVQRPAPGGGRIVQAVKYDARGLTTSQAAAFYNNGVAGSGIVNAADSTIPSLTTVDYDNLERPTAEHLKALGAEKWQTTTAYQGDRITVTRPDGILAVQEMDANGRTTKSTRYPTVGVGESTTYLYDRLDQLTQVTSPAGNMTKYGYDLEGRRFSTEDPDAGTSTSTFDEVGNVKSSTDAQGHKLSYVNDALGRRKATWKGEVDTGVKLAEWTYDTAPGGKGAVATATRYSGGKAYTVSADNYDSRGRATASTYKIPTGEGQLTGDYTIQQAYDAADHVVAVIYPAAGGLAAETVTAGYDNLGYPTTTAGLTDYITQTDHTKIGQLAGRKTGAGPGQLTRSYVWDSATGRLAENNATVAGNPVQADKFTYDQVGNPKRILDATDNQSQCFRYDGIDRLTEAWTTPGDCTAAPSTADLTGKAPYWETYTFDTAGNRATDVRRKPGQTTTRSFAYGAGKPHALSKVTTNGTDGPTFTYDNDGNTLVGTVRGIGQTYTWDEEGRVATLSAGGSTTTHLYDAGGALLIRRDPTGTTLYLPGQDIRTAGGQLTSNRYYGTAAIRASDGTLTWMASDTQASGRVAVNATTGQVTKRYYTPYGDDRDPVTTWPTDRGFLNKPKNSHTGLNSLGAREYDADLGRFLSTDPIIDHGDPTGINPYAYAAHNPIANSDPTGLQLSRGAEISGGGGGMTVVAGQEYKGTLRERILGRDRAKPKPREEPKPKPPAPTSRTAAQIERQAKSLEARQNRQLEREVKNGSDVDVTPNASKNNPKPPTPGEPSPRNNNPKSNPPKKNAPGHTVEVTHHNAETGEVTVEYGVRSGNITTEESAALGGKGRNAQQASHTEHRVGRSSGASSGKNPIPDDPMAGQVPAEPGSVVAIKGQLPPCAQCKGAMNRMVRELDVDVVYSWDGPKGSGSWIRTRSGK
ncbi:ricin-type beta-trefoil lectin domain protein [Longispora fulva]|uniref:ricin-type beta-trefoil lectin domain protein n=1 Tax=Longispora fulva TaxID=619741 RepID=UPI003638A255